MVSGSERTKARASASCGVNSRSRRWGVCRIFIAQSCRGIQNTRTRRIDKSSRVIGEIGILRQRRTINQRACTYIVPRFHKHAGSSPTLSDDTLAILDSTLYSSSLAIPLLTVRIDAGGSRLLSVLQSPYCIFLVGLE